MLGIFGWFDAMCRGLSHLPRGTRAASSKHDDANIMII